MARVIEQIRHQAQTAIMENLWPLHNNDKSGKYHFWYISHDEIYLSCGGTYTLDSLYNV